MKSAEGVRQIWAMVTLGRWLRALGSVYITLTDQGKKKKKQIPAACMSRAGERLPSLAVCADSSNEPPPLPYCKCSPV